MRRFALTALVVAALLGCEEARDDLAFRDPYESSGDDLNCRHEFERG